MKAYIVDISGRVPEYDEGLCFGLSKNDTNNEITFVAPYDNFENYNIRFIRLFKLIPKQLSHGKLRRALKVIEIIINYIYLLSLIKKDMPNVIQMEWLPLSEKIGVEAFFLSMVKKSNASSKIILKIHNVFPHECISSEARSKYIQRFKQCSFISDAFIVHTQSSKEEVSRIFGIDLNRINVIHHGVFEPKDCKVIDKEIGVSGKWNFLMYGIQSRYKGADILVNSLAALPEELKSMLNVKIVGMMSDDYYHELSSINTGVDITIMPRFVEFPDLYRMINESDVILLPYRKISQSGVLLLALHFHRCLITSDLDSFKETLDGFEEGWFFKSEDNASLANIITKYLTGQINIKKQMGIIKSLNNKYSWEEAGKLNVELIHRIVL